MNTYKLPAMNDWRGVTKKVGCRGGLNKIRLSNGYEDNQITPNHTNLFHPLRLDRFLKWSWVVD